MWAGWTDGLEGGVLSLTDVRAKGFEPIRRVYLISQLKYSGKAGRVCGTRGEQLEQRVRREAPPKAGGVGNAESSKLCSGSSEWSCPDLISRPFPGWSISSSSPVKCEPSGENAFSVIPYSSAPSIPFFLFEGRTPNQKSVSLLLDSLLKMDGFAGSLGECYSTGPRHALPFWILLIAMQCFAAAAGSI